MKESSTWPLPPHHLAHHLAGQHGIVPRVSAARTALLLQGGERVRKHPVGGALLTDDLGGSNLDAHLVVLGAGQAAL